VKRRAPALCKKLKSQQGTTDDPLAAIDWLNLWALAVNEENAAGGRVVTAPTNGAAGIIPSVLHYYMRFVMKADDDGAVRFLLTAAAIASLYKRNAFALGGGVGCQGEVGVACSMAAAGLAEVLGGSCEQVENAAEIGMEHNLASPVTPSEASCRCRASSATPWGGEGAQRRAPRHAGRRQAQGVARSRHRHDAADRRRHVDQVQGDVPSGLAVNVIEC